MSVGIAARYRRSFG